jgi:hypothetical protein
MYSRGNYSEFSRKWRTTGSLETWVLQEIAIARDTMVGQARDGMRSVLIEETFVHGVMYEELIKLYYREPGQETDKRSFIYLFSRHYCCILGM